MALKVLATMHLFLPVISKVFGVVFVEELINSVKLMSFAFRFCGFLQVRICVFFLSSDSLTFLEIQKHPKKMKYVLLDNFVLEEFIYHY